MSRRHATRRLASVSIASRRSSAKCAVLCRRREARRRFSSVVVSDILRFTCAKYDGFWRRRDARRFVSIGRMVSRVFYWLHLQFVVDVATSSSLNMASFGGVATTSVPTLGVGLSDSNSSISFICVSASEWQHLASVLQLRSMYHPEDHLR
jgi:hypothetical protein